MTINRTPNIRKNSDYSSYAQHNSAVLAIPYSSGDEKAIREYQANELSELMTFDNTPIRGLIEQKENIEAKLDEAETIFNMFDIANIHKNTITRKAQKELVDGYKELNKRIYDAEHPEQSAHRELKKAELDIIRKLKW